MLMDRYDPTRSRHRTIPSVERLIGAFPHAPVESTASTPSSLAMDELSEEEVVFSFEDNAASSHSVTPSSSSASSVSSASSPWRHLLHPYHNQPRSRKNFSQQDSFGILAALPEKETTVRGVSHFCLKTSVSPSSSYSSSTSSRLIPVIPRPPRDRILFHSSSPMTRYPQSAPVNVPILSRERINMQRRQREMDANDDVDEYNKDEEMLPPHEIVARIAARSPILSCSVLEGAGRTLKGRDLRQVRSAVLRQTGFAD